jgi:hypothetical protein
MTIEHHPRPFGARIVDGVKVAALLFVLSVIVAAADRALVSPDAYFPSQYAAPASAPEANVEAF